MNEERAAEGVDHLQRAAREMVAAARSFLDVVEELVEDRAALEDVASAVSGVAGAVGQVVRRTLDGRPAPWETAAWGDPPWEHEEGDRGRAAVDLTDATPAGGGDHGRDESAGADEGGADEGETEEWAASLVTPDRPDRTRGTGAPSDDAAAGPVVRPGSRVRRIVVD